MAALDDILAGYEALRPAQEALYQDLHRHPELSHEEHHTAQRVGDLLRQDGFTVTGGIGGTGVVGVLANGSGPAVLLRCELDALPIREATGAPYASTVTVPDASGHLRPAAHACGHDLHMAAMISMAKLMADHRDRWHGTLIPLFQPAEETGEGAQDMVDDGLFKKVPVPDVALAQHLLPGIAGTVRTRSGPFMSAAARPPRACARPAHRSSSAATSSSGSVVAWARCQARRSGSACGSMTSASVRCARWRSARDAAR